jgi:hypothetical protein
MANFRLQVYLQRSNRQTTAQSRTQCPMGSWLAIRIVGYIFITLFAAGKGVGWVKLQSGPAG